MNLSILKTFIALILVPQFVFAEGAPSSESGTSSVSNAVNSIKDLIDENIVTPLGKMFEADPKEQVSNCNLTGEGKSLCEELVSVAEDLLFETAPNSFPLIDKKSSVELNSALQSYQSSVKNCHNHQLRAAKVCLSSENKDLQDAMTAMTLMTAAGNSTNQACTSMGKALGVASAALTAYQSVCAAAKSVCLPSCSKANTALQNITKIVGSVKLNSDVIMDPKVNVSALQAKLNSIQSKIVNLSKKDLVADDASTTAGKLNVCSNKYGQLLLSAATGVTSLSQAKKTADACAGASAGVAMNLDEKCKLSEHKNSQECICHLSPRTPGCSNSLDKIGSENSGLAVGSANPTDSQNKDNSLSGDLGGRGPTATADNKESGGGSRGAGGMPLAGGLGSSTAGGGGSGSPSGGAEQFPGTYSYDDSGSGGGGGWGSGGGGSWGTDGTAMDSGLEAYLPDGEKDPNALSGMSDEPSYVTPEGGKSNFEKVRQVYGEVRSTLLDK